MNITSKRGVLVTGHAGAGKTTKMTSLLPELISEINILDYQIIPTISAMHGARRRLTKRLVQVQKKFSLQGISFRFSVETIDSLALQIANRCRGLIAFNRALIPFNDQKIHQPIEGTIPVSKICDIAVKALKNASAQRMVQNSFPFVLIDELQDCKDSKFEFIKELSKCVPIIAAADDFQDIDINLYEAPAVSWAKSVFEHIDLGRNSFRTRNPRIINTAAALRGIPGTGPPYVNVYTYPGAGMAAKTIMTYVRKYKWRGPTALLSFSMNCNFLKGILKSLHKVRKPEEEMQPLIFKGLVAESNRADSLIKEIETLIDGQYINAKAPPLSNLPKNIEDAWKYCKNISRRRGKEEFSRTFLTENALRKLHWDCSYGSIHSKRLVLSVHSAKNQEWDNVFVVWSDRKFPANTTEEYKRRILYNAVTRARCNCLILVHDPLNTESVIEKNSFLKVLKN